MATENADDIAIETGDHKSGIMKWNVDDTGKSGYDIGEDDGVKSKELGRGRFPSVVHVHIKDAVVYIRTSLDVLTKYSVHNPKIAFLCKKAGSAVSHLSTPSDPETAHVIRLLYGHSIAKELINVKVSSKAKPKPKLPGNREDDEMNGDYYEEDNDESESWSAD
ncbi:uncharacterized protein LACBIDRAFT_332816 [Laccaria bicolor S238N-H82]|uniref:Predicted protein n=1 Tax=Laccaria bicolor (strain S238N-H82 / ATCC MYA-4686) TaxID=486041 RepID=B0DTS7_LACBS|nr:uncharacterized protein LACBIDRAFT_332816 [Laccaria bicolor S238N-H82]EDR01962.1 predicted protein [Laccaria bicolor S238N-H82]|eukprot:XP_001887353.1 predicted protein [Laccaria bicolor S238N-H82]